MSSKLLSWYVITIHFYLVWHEQCVHGMCLQTQHSTEEGGAISASLSSLCGSFIFKALK